MGDAPLTFSVAIPTLGRTDQLSDLLTSIVQSAAQPNEVIIVDQNSDDRLTAVIEKFPSLPIAHHRVLFRGLSAAKNYAARSAKSEILFTPDDDCRVQPDTFAAALEAFNRTGAHAVFGKCVDEQGGDAIIVYNANAGWLSPGHIDGMFVEPATAVRIAVLRETPFDETLGVGTFHGAEEGYDWVLRLVESGKRLYFEPGVKLFHPKTITNYASPQALARVYSYRCGFGRLCKKHGLWGKYAKRVALVSGAIAVYSLTNKSKSRYYRRELKGLVDGVMINP